MDDLAAVCVRCGVSRGIGNRYCQNCGTEIPQGVAFCVNCGAPVAAQGTVIPNGYEQKSKMVAGLLGIFIGSLGVHNFYLGFTSKAVLQIVVSFVTCGVGGIWGFIEGILILTGSINTDANNIPLKD